MRVLMFFSRVLIIDNVHLLKLVIHTKCQECYLTFLSSDAFDLGSLFNQTTGFLLNIGQSGTQTYSSSHRNMKNT